MKTVSLRQLGFITAMFTVCLAPTSRAALLVYEGFDYSLSNGANMAGVTTNALGLSGNYQTSHATSVHYTTSGLTFGSSFFPTEAGAVVLRSTADFSQPALGVNLNAGTQTGTLWQSYLFQVESFTGVNAFSGFGNLVSNSATGTGSARFASYGKAELTGFTTTNQARPGVRYNGGLPDTSSGGGAAPNNPANAIASGITYLVVASFTNVGGTLSVENPGVATQWVFTQSAYDAWQTTGGGLESSLSTYAIWTATNSATSGANTFSNTGFFQLRGRDSDRNLAVTMDEVRWGTSMGDVIAVIPEPSTWGLLTGGLTLALVLRRRRA